jgi:hypothetical protein
MSKVEALYQKHLDKLREGAAKDRIPFIDYLHAAYIPLTRNALIALLIKGETHKETEENLISHYRLGFFETVANVAMNMNQSEVEAIANNMAIELSQAAVAVQNKQVEVLATGRKKGNVARTAKADELKANVDNINADLLKRPRGENWTLEARANHIANKVGRKESYIRKLIASPRKTKQA